MADTEINALFAPSAGGALPSDVASELQHISNLLDISPQELFYKWESYAIKMGTDRTKLDLKTVKEFKKDLQDAMERESRAKSHHAHQSAVKRAAPTPRGGGGGGVGDDVFGMLDGLILREAVEMML